MKRLFKVSQPGRDLRYFESRQAAKDYIETTYTAGTKSCTARIHRGPDHWKGETDGSYSQTPSSKKTEW